MKYIVSVNGGAVCNIFLEQGAADSTIVKNVTLFLGKLNPVEYCDYGIRQFHLKDLILQIFSDFSVRKAKISCG